MSSELRGQSMTPDASLSEDYVATPRGDILGGLLFLVWAAFGWVSVLTSPAIFMTRGGDPGPALLPVAVLTLLTIGGLVVVGLGVRRRLKGEREPEAAESLGSPVISLLFIVSLVALPTVMQLIGFVVTTSLWIATWIFVLARSGGSSSRQAGLLAVIGAGTITSVVYAVFVMALRVRLPGV
jgi:hypothetical protein